MVLYLFLIHLLFANLGNKKDSAFGWSERYKVAVGVAEALVYLHDSCDQPVIHGDVKSSNILLSDDFEPQVILLVFCFLHCICHMIKCAVIKLT